ncbi:MAG: hypothetical protein GKR90_17860 [Pseudomonadales bacterium]|nr:hypothetical protein [Pseudomonadales bacterium]
MADFTTLLILAELAISLIGVSGIVAVFLTAKPIGSLDSARFLAIVATGCLVAFLAFVPVWINRHFAFDFDIWRASSIVALISAVVVNLVVGAFAHTSIRQVAQSFSGTQVASRIGASVMTIAVIVLMLVNIFGWPIPPNGTVYEVMLFVGLVQMAIAFASLVLSTDHDE